jgi:hypothetical protein
MRMTTPEIVLLIIIATLGHAMALLWHLAVTRKWKICERTIYALPISSAQISLAAQCPSEVVPSRTWSIPARARFWKSFGIPTLWAI